MKIGIYSPYLDTLGGGERYMLTFAEFCLARGFDVELFWPEGETIALAIQRFNLKLQNLKLNSELFHSFSPEASYMDKIKRNFKLKKYDLIFYLSDGSIPNLSAKKNWLHFQTPFQIDGYNFKTQMKLGKIHKVIVNSKFTKKFIDKSFKIKSDVIYPPVSVSDFNFTNLEQKQNIILSVGRFDQIQNAKRQDVLIEVFKSLCDDGMTNWQLVLAGSQTHNEENLMELRKNAIDYPINFKVNIQYEEIVNLNKKARIYWHATGFEIDESKNPEKVEHFGISVVEAMSASCIPIVCKAGGLEEIIKDKENGYFWQTEDQLKNITKNIIENLEKENNIVKNANKDSQKYSKQNFFNQLQKILS